MPPVVSICFERVAGDTHLDIPPQCSNAVLACTAAGPGNRLFSTTAVIGNSCELTACTSLCRKLGCWTERQADKVEWYISREEAHVYIEPGLEERPLLLLDRSHRKTCVW
jgi:hypothetical protein